MSEDRWYFSKEELENSPSRRCGIDADKELHYRQLAANLIHDMGSRKHLTLNQLCISTAMVYMHRFYVYHSFTHFQWNTIAMASLFLAAKVEEQTRKIEHIIRVAQWCLQKSQISIDNTPESYANQVQELVMNENILLQTLGFDVAVKHPHAFIVEFSERLKYNKELTKIMYGMASNSLHVTNMCVRYKPSVVACFCVHFVCKWSAHEIQKNGEELNWWTSIDPSVTPELLQQMGNEFLEDFDKSPPKLKAKVLELLRSQCMSSNHPFNSTDRTPNTNGHPSSGHSLISTSPSSGSSTSSSHHQKNHQSSMSKHNVPGVSRMHKSSTAYLPNHHRSSHPSMNGGFKVDPNSIIGSSQHSKNNSNHRSSHPPINGGLNVDPNSVIGSSQHSKNDPTARTSSQQQQQQQHHHQRHLQLQQRHHQHHVHMSQNVHKSSSSGLVHNVPKPKINPVTIGLPTTNGSVSGNVPANEMKPDQRKTAVTRLKPGLNVEQDATAAAVVSISSHRRITETTVKDTHQKIGPPREFKWPVTNSRSKFMSNAIKEMAIANPNETRTELPGMDTVDSVAVTKLSKNHSIFSPSPPMSHDRFNFSLVEEQTLPAEVEVKQEPVDDTIQIPQISPAEVEIKQEILPSELDFSTMKTPPRPKNEHCRSGILRTDVKMIKTEYSFDNKLISVPSTTVASQQPTNISIITGAVGLTPPFNDVTIKKGPCEIGKDHVEIFNVSSQPTIPNITEENAVCVGKIDTNTNSNIVCESSSTSHNHKKKKKHKEKDKNYRDRKHHKEEKHHHRKEHSSREKERKDPSPIKITIPKEKLTDIPVKLKIIINNKDQIVQPSTSETAKADIAVKINAEKASKSRKRKRESDHDHKSKKLPFNGGTTSQNGF